VTLRHLSFAALLPLLGACYSYMPIEVSAVRPGASVRARVSQPAALQLAPLLHVSDARVVTGTLIDSVTDGVLVEVPTIVPGEVGSTFETLHQRVSIARSDLVEFETRKIDRLRTGVIVGVAALAASVVIVRALSGDAGRDRPPPGGGTDLRLPVRRF
jgi:hypothetical protein